MKATNPGRSAQPSLAGIVRFPAGVSEDAATLRELMHAGPQGLEDAGFTPAQARRLLTVFAVAREVNAQPLKRGAPFRSSRDVFQHYAPMMRDLPHEQFRIVLLDGKHRVLRDVLVSQGTLTSSPVHPREVFRPAIQHGAAAMVLVHNHPSGDPAPSGDDLEITRRLRDVGDLVGIRVLDHLVIGDGRYCSLADRGLMGGAL